MASVRFRLNDKEATCKVAQPNTATLASLLLSVPALAADSNVTYRFTLRGKPLDPDAPWRFAGVPTNACVDVALPSADHPPPPPPPAPSRVPNAAAVAVEAPVAPTVVAAALLTAAPPSGDVLAQAVQAFRAQTWDAEAKVALPTLAKLLRNAFASPHEDKYRTLRTSNPALRDKLGGSNAALDVLRAAGFRDCVRDGDAFLVLEDADVVTLARAHGLVAALAAELGCAPVDPLPAAPAAPPPRAAPAAAAAAFDPFRTSVLTSQPRAPALEESPVQLRVNALRQKQRELLQATLQRVERRPVLVRAPDDFNPRRFARAAALAAAATGSEDDSTDMQALSLHHKEVSERMRKQENFQTRAMRELDELSRARVFPFCVVRVLLPGRVILQARFSPLETARDVAALVADACGLPDAAGFHLVSGPPPQRVPLDAVLHEAGFVPSAVFQAVAADASLVPARGEWGSVDDLLEDMPAGVALVAEPKREAPKPMGKPKWLKGG